VGEQHLDALAVVARLLERLSSAQRTSDIASVFMDAAWDLARRLLGAASHFEWAYIAIELARPVNQLVGQSAAKPNVATNARTVLLWLLGHTRCCGRRKLNLSFVEYCTTVLEYHSRRVTSRGIRDDGTNIRSGLGT
jgi:hypothetical protein